MVDEQQHSVGEARVSITARISDLVQEILGALSNFSSIIHGSRAEAGKRFQLRNE
jgi:hypothetical protein